MGLNRPLTLVLAFIFIKHLRVQAAANCMGKC